MTVSNQQIKCYIIFGIVNLKLFWMHILGALTDLSKKDNFISCKCKHPSSGKYASESKFIIRTIIVHSYLIIIAG